MTKRPSIASLAPRKVNAVPTTSVLQTPLEHGDVADARSRGARHPAPYKAVLSKVDEATHRQLKILAIEEGIPVGDLQIEAINLLFRARGLPEIAVRITPNERRKSD